MTCQRRAEVDVLRQKAYPATRPGVRWVFTKHLDHPGSRTRQTQYQFQQGSLAGAIVADKCDAAPMRDPEVDVLNNVESRNAFGEVRNFDWERHLILPRAGGGSMFGGCIKGAESKTPPVCRAGN